MILAKFIESQIKQAIEHPAAFPSCSAIFGTLAGMSVGELLVGGPVPVHQYVFVLFWLLMTVWHASIATLAIRRIRASNSASAQKQEPIANS